MDIRFLRLNGAGDISKSFSYRFQLEFVDDPRILDAYLTWHQYKPFQIRVGQMKRNFTYENKLSPAALGLSEFSMVIQKLTGFSDRVGEHACGGRDIGFIFMGDLFKIKDLHFLHYDLGIFNVNVINKAENNKSKDIIASLKCRPIKNLQFGAGFWDGEFGPEGTTVDRKRWTTGFRYEDPKYLLSAEYIYSKGQRINSDKVIFGADHSDGWYITGGFPVYKNIKIYGKYDVYRDDRTNNTKSEKYIGAINFKPHKNLLFQVSYVYNNLYDIDSYNNVVGQVFFTF